MSTVNIDKMKFNYMQEVLMEEIRDVYGRRACFADPDTGVIENAYKKQVTEAVLPVGGRFTICREGAMTVIHRTGEHSLSVQTYKTA